MLGLIFRVFFVVSLCVLAESRTDEEGEEEGEEDKEIRFMDVDAADESDDDML